MSRHRAVGGIGKPPFPQRGLCLVRPRPRITEGKEPIQQYALFPLASPSPPASRRPSLTRDRPVQRQTARPAALWRRTHAPSGYSTRPRAGPIAGRKAGRLPRQAAVPPCVRWQGHIVAAEQDMLAHRHAPDVWERALLVQAQFEKAEIRSATADIDDQYVPQIGIVTVDPLPQLMRRVVFFQPATERSLRLL